METSESLDRVQRLKSRSRSRDAVESDGRKSASPSSRNNSEPKSKEYREQQQEYAEPQAFEIETEELDPRVQLELEKLNSCTDEINRLEVKLDDANTTFRSLLTDSTHHLKALHKKLGSCIEKARPYYEALESMTKAQAECQQAAIQFQRAAGIHAAAKETISLAEERFLDNSGEWQFDNAWQEMLNHATIKVMDAEKQRTASEKEHLARSAAFSAVESRVKTLEKKLSRHIDKSKPYFEQKDAFNKALNLEKARVGELQSKICQAKAQYAQSLRNLEEISESIHERRKYSKRRQEEDKLTLCTEMDSLTFNLDSNLRSRAGSEFTLSEVSGRDSALGSCSLVGGDSDGQDSQTHQQDKPTNSKTTVSRSLSLPDQLNSPLAVCQAKNGGRDIERQHSEQVPSVCLNDSASIQTHQVFEQKRPGEESTASLVHVGPSSPGKVKCPELPVAGAVAAQLCDRKDVTSIADNTPIKL